MGRSSILVIASLGLTLSACGWQTKVAPPETAVTAPPAHATQVAANNAQDDPNTTICKREEVTGSRLPASRICHTRAEWAQLKATGMDQLQMLGAPGPTPSQTAAQNGAGAP